MKPSIECRRLAELLREKAMAIRVPELKAEYEYFIRGFLRLAFAVALISPPKRNRKIGVISA